MFTRLVERATSLYEQKVVIPRKARQFNVLYTRVGEALNGTGPLANNREVTRHARQVENFIQQNSGVFLTQPVIPSIGEFIFTPFAATQGENRVWNGAWNSFYKMGNTPISKEDGNDTYDSTRFDIAVFRENVRRVIELYYEHGMPNSEMAFRELPAKYKSWLVENGLVQVRQEKSGRYFFDFNVGRTWETMINDGTIPHTVIGKNSRPNAIAIEADIITNKRFQPSILAATLGDKIPYQSITHMRAYAGCKYDPRKISETSCESCTYANSCALRAIVASKQAYEEDRKFWVEECLGIK